MRQATWWPPSVVAPSWIRIPPPSPRRVTPLTGNDPTKFTVTVHEYDEMGRRIKTITNDGNTLSERTQLVAYDALNRVRRTIDNYVAQGGVDPYDLTVTSFDNGDEDNENLVTEIDYNERGMVRKQTDVLGNVTLFGYDGAGRLIRTIQNAATPDHNNTYLEAISGNDPDPMLADYPYDSANPSDAADEDLITAYAYDAANNQIAVQDPLGRVTYTMYDRLNRVIKTVVNAKDEADMSINPGIANYDVADDPRSDHYVASTEKDRDLIQTQGYDGLGRIWYTQDVLDRFLVYGYDEVNQRVLTVGNYVGSGVP